MNKNIGESTKLNSRKELSTVHIGTGLAGINTSLAIVLFFTYVMNLPSQSILTVNQAWFIVLIVVLGLFNFLVFISVLISDNRKKEIEEKEKESDSL